MLTRIRTAREDGEGGFTLIELLVVIIIIGILSAIAIPTYLNQQQKAREASVQADATALATNVQSLIVDAPANITLAPAALANAGEPVTLTAGTDTIDVQMSPNNYVAAFWYNSSDGSYCVQVNNTDTAVTSSHVLTGAMGDGSCPSAP